MADTALTMPATMSNQEEDFFSFGSVNDISCPLDVPIINPMSASNSALYNLDYYSPPLTGELGTIPPNTPIPTPQLQAELAAGTSSKGHLYKQVSGLVEGPSSKAEPTQSESRHKGKKAKGKRTQQKSPTFELVQAPADPERTTPKRRRDADEETGDRRDAKRSRTILEPYSCAMQTDTRLRAAYQLLYAVPQGDGGVSLPRRQVEQDSTDNHVPEQLTTISGASNQAGASNRKEPCETEASKARLQEKRIIEGAIGKPAPDLRDLTQGTRTLKQVREEVSDRQLCLHSYDGKDCCGQAYNKKFGNRREFHYTENHRCCLPPGTDKEGSRVMIKCPQPGCGETIDRWQLDSHLRKQEHLLADMRFLRQVCPVEDCPMKTIDYVPGSFWFRRESRKHEKVCSYRGKHFNWKVVSEEPNLADYKVYL